MAYAHAARYADDFTDRSGPPVVDRAVYVYVGNGPGATVPALLYADPDRTVPLLNPTTTGPLGNVEFFAEPGLYRLVVAGQPFDVTIDEDPRDARLPLDQQLVAWTEARAYAMTTIAYHGTYDHAVSVATVLWPDGSTGTLTGTVFNPAFGTTDAYSVTHDDSGLTVAQPVVTRNGAGLVTVKPPLTVT